MMEENKKICLDVLNNIKAFDKEWKDIDFIITTKDQLLKIALEIYKEIKNG